MTIRFLFFLMFVFSFAPLAYSAPSVTEQRQEVIQKARQDLDEIRTKLTQKMNEQVKEGDKEGARNTQVRILAATDLANMLDTPSQAGGDIFKVRLIESYNGILNISDYSEVSFREVMNGYRRIGPDQVYDASYIAEARVDTKSDKKDLMALRAWQDRAIYFAAQSTYEDMHSGFQRGMAGVALALNDTFADINPATSLLETVVGTKVSGSDIGRDMTAGERAGSLLKFFIEAAADVGADKLMKDTMKGLTTAVGPGTGSSQKSFRRADGGDAPEASPKAADAPPLGANERVIGQVDLNDADNIDDMSSLIGLDNFNIDLRTGQVTASPSGGRIGPRGKAQLDADFNSPASAANPQATGATVAVAPPSVKGDRVIGHIDLSTAEDALDTVGLTGLENFNIDLRTGRVTTSSHQGGRLDDAGQKMIEEGFKPQGPLGGDQKIDVDFQHRTTEIDIQGQTTVMERAVWGGTFNKGFKDPKAPPRTRGPRDELKPIWDLFDLPPEESLNIPAPKQILPVIIYVEDPQGGPRIGILIDVFKDALSPVRAFPADPFGDCLGPSCVPAFGGPDLAYAQPPVGPDFHSSSGGPGSQFISNDQFLVDPVFFNQRFGELFGGVSPSQDPNDQAN